MNPDLIYIFYQARMKFDINTSNPRTIPTMLEKGMSDQGVLHGTILVLYTLVHNTIALPPRLW